MKTIAELTGFNNLSAMRWFLFLKYF